MRVILVPFAAVALALPACVRRSPAVAPGDAPAVTFVRSCAIDIAAKYGLVPAPSTSAMGTELRLATKGEATAITRDVLHVAVRQSEDGASAWAIVGASSMQRHEDAVRRITWLPERQPSPLARDLVKQIEGDCRIAP